MHSEWIAVQHISSSNESKNVGYTDRSKEKGKILLAIGCSMLVRWYMNQTMNVKWGTYFSDPFTVTNG